MSCKHAQDTHTHTHVHNVLYAYQTRHGILRQSSTSATPGVCRELPSAQLLDVSKYVRRITVRVSYLNCRGPVVHFHDCVMQGVGCEHPGWQGSCLV